MSEGKKTALLGGSFDPVHNGHIQAAVQVGEKLNLDKTVFVPSYRNPQKCGAHAEAGTRLEMLKLAVSEIPGLEVSSVETDKKSVSYTADTLRLWKIRHKNDSLWFVMGEDLFAGMAEWKNFRDIFENANIAVISRPVKGKPSRPVYEPPFEIRRDFLYDNQCMGTVCFRHRSGSKLSFMEIDALDISSTEIRDLIRKREAFEHLVPPAVADFIKRKKLYCGEPQR